MTFLIQQTLIYAVPLMIVALAGVFAERSGIINLALEGIMIFGAFIGVLFVRLMQGSQAVLAAKQAGDWVALQGLELLTMLVAAAMGAVFSLLLSFASINLRADQTIGGTALNLMAPALVLFLIRIIANQNTLQMATGDSASWFMLKKSTFGVDKNVDWGFFGETFLNKIYLATYICILLFIILSVILYKTKFGLRLRACGENPQAADSLGINVYRMRYAGVTISGALAGMGGFVYAMTTANCSSNGDVAGFGFLALVSTWRARHSGLKLDHLVVFCSFMAAPLLHDDGQNDGALQAGVVRIGEEHVIAARMLVVDLPGDLDLRRIDARPVLRLQHGGDQAAVILRCLISRGIDEVIRKRDDGMPGRAVADHHGQGEHGRVARTVCDLHTDAVVALGADGQVHERQAHLVREIAVKHILGLQTVEQGDGAADAVDEWLRQGEARLVIIRIVDRPRERAEV